LQDLLRNSEEAYGSTCDTRKVLDLLVDKWAALIMGILGQKTIRFADLHRKIAGISQKMLTQTLRHLERDGLVQRTVYAEVPPRVEYALTPLGQSLRELMTPIREWSSLNLNAIFASQKQYDARQPNAKAPTPNAQPSQ
jgi:DNA-binding HxlR family transcriptional regulator